MKITKLENEEPRHRSKKKKNVTVRWKFVGIRYENFQSSKFDFMYEDSTRKYSSVKAANNAIEFFKKGRGFRYMKLGDWVGEIVDRD